MTLRRDGEQPQAEVSALLRAVGQLLIAISGDPASAAARPEPPPRQSSPPLDEIGEILADARARAQQLVDESFAEAGERIEQLALERAPPGAPPAAEGPAADGDLEERLRSLQELLSDIEALQQAEAEPEAPEAEPGAPAGEAAEPPAPEPPVPEPAPAEPAAAAEADAAAERVEAVRWSKDQAEQGLVFQPEDGSVLVRVAPVEGFQGLLRVQGVLAQLAGVNQAFVEGYAQGEAQLRLTFDSPVAVGRLAGALGERLGVPVEAADVSEPDRSLRFELR